MANNLPPYSTFRTDAKQMMFPRATSHGNVLTFVPPGFHHCLNVKFPDSRLAVCEKCKKNYKTRDMCRVRNAHTSPPWSTAYICMTIDDSCLDEKGKFVDEPLTVRMVQWQPYCVKTTFGDKTPVCAACKRTNRTKSFCREKHKHKHLPWSTVYVLLSTVKAAEPKTIVAEPSKLVPPEERKKSASKESPKKNDGSDTVNSSDSAGDDIHDIADSRTMLIQVSCHASSVHWVELSSGDFDQESAPFPGNGAATHEQAAFQVAAEANHPSAQYYGHGMGYSVAQDTQNRLKNSQQFYFQYHQNQRNQSGATNPGSGGVPSWQGYGLDGTAGEASAGQQHGRAGEDQPHWANFYGGQTPYIAADTALTNGGDDSNSAAQTDYPPPENEAGSQEGPRKRQRAIQGL